MKLPTFSRDDTNAIKGIAILAMVLHHLYPGSNCECPVYRLENVDVLTILAASGKVCVALFTILSGCGLSVRYRELEHGAGNSFLRGVSFSISHYVQLLSVFWAIALWKLLFVWIHGVAVSSVFGHGFDGMCNFAIEFLGLGFVFQRPPILGDWFFSAIAMYYLFFPALYFLVKRLRMWLVGLAYAPWVYYLAVKFQSPDTVVRTDNCVFYLVAFLVGIYFAQTRWPDRLKCCGLRKSGPVAILCFAVAFALRMVITLPADLLLAITLIPMGVLMVPRIGAVLRLLQTLGAHSADIWLLHVFVAQHIVVQGGDRGFGAYFTAVIFFSMGISAVIGMLKRGLGYADCVSRIRSLIQRG